jgi:hypothetical protein
MRPGVDLRTAQFGSVSRTRRLPYTCGCFPSEHSLAAVDVGSPGVRVDAAGSTDPGGLDGARVHHPVDGHGRGPGLSGALSDGHQLAGGCHQPAAACEVHHLRHKGCGGVTSLENCIMLVSPSHRHPPAGLDPGPPPRRPPPPPNGTGTKPTSSAATAHPARAG